MAWMAFPRTSSFCQRVENIASSEALAVKRTLLKGVPSTLASSWLKWLPLVHVVIVTGSINAHILMTVCTRWHLPSASLTIGLACVGQRLSICKATGMLAFLFSLSQARQGLLMCGLILKSPLNSFSGNTWKPELLLCLYPFCTLLSREQGEIGLRAMSFYYIKNLM